VAAVRISALCTRWKARATPLSTLPTFPNLLYARASAPARFLIPAMIHISARAQERVLLEPDALVAQAIVDRAARALDPAGHRLLPVDAEVVTVRGQGLDVRLRGEIPITSTRADSFRGQRLEEFRAGKVFKLPLVVAEHVETSRENCASNRPAWNSVSR
jgi:hypothetical protein